jgi:hypothetical protein
VSKVTAMGVIIVILANSVKHHNHCVAGKDIATKSWIRIVSDASGKELSNDQVRYRNPYGIYQVDTLQKIEMELGDPVPLLHQPENFLRSDSEWVQKYKLDQNELCNYVDNPVNIWGEGAALSAHDIQNGFTEIESSLYLVYVEKVHFYTSNKDKKRVRFLYNDIEYDLPVTDPNFHKYIKGHVKHNGFFCISLGENFNGYHYKIVATIFLREMM